MEPEQQAPVPMIVWCGGINAKQDVSIRLVPNGINQQQVTDLRSQEPLAVVKVHSTRLKKHSNYFQACLSTTWTNPDAPPSMEFSLELIYGLQVATYTDCFSRMYTPLRNKNFKDVTSSLELLRVASQIEFLELVKSICRYLSTVLWSEEDEFRIRQFSSSHDFPRSQAEDLMTRLHIGEHGNEETYHKKSICHLIAPSIRIALRQEDDSGDREDFYDAQYFFADLFRSIGQSQVDSAFENDVITIVSKEVKEMLESFHEDCLKHFRFPDTLLDMKWAAVVVKRVSGFERKLRGLYWALELLLKTQVAEEVIECLLHLDSFFTIITAADGVDRRKPASEAITMQFGKLVILIIQDVVAGRLLLSTQDRLLLFERWKTLHDHHLEKPSTHSILVSWGFGQAVEDLFLTLPLEQQMEAIQWSNFTFPGDICRCTLISLMKRNWPAEDLDAFLDVADAEADVQAEVHFSCRCFRSKGPLRRA